MSSGKVEREVLPQTYVGERFTVIHCEGAVDSFFEAMRSEKATKIRSMANGIAALIMRLGAGQIMSGQNFPAEDYLPDGSRFHAFKRIPVRAYVWRSTRRKNVYFISHYTMKREDPLAPRDTAEICRNWTRIEVKNEER